MKQKYNEAYPPYIYDKKNINNDYYKKKKKQEERKRFDLKRKYFLRECTHRFLSLDIYQRFTDFFIVPTLFLSTDIDIDIFNENIKIFLDNIKSNKLHSGFQQPLLELELAKNILYLTTKDKKDLLKIDYITFEEYNTLTTLELKDKIASSLLHEYLNAETIRYVSLTLKDHNLTKQSFQNIISDVETYITNSTAHGLYSRETLKLLRAIQNTSIDDVAFFTDLPKDEKNVVIENTVAIFEKADNVILDDTLLKVLGINKEIYSSTMQDDNIQKIITKLFENTILISSIESDTLHLNFTIDNNEATKYIISKKHVNSYSSASLYHFTKGVLNGLPYIVFIEILMTKKSSKKKRVLKNLETQITNNKPSYTNHLKIFQLLVTENSHKNILLIVSIAYELSLSQTQAWTLSVELGLNNKKSFRKYYPMFYELLYPNYKLIKNRT